jgi:hypothetical protein
VILAANAARGAIVVDLVPEVLDPGLPPGWYVPIARPEISVFLRQDPPSEDRTVQMVQFDLHESRAGGLGGPGDITLPETSPGLHFWIVPCGAFCFDIDDNLSDTPSDILRIERNQMFPQFQLLLPGEGTPVQIGLVTVLLDGPGGSYVLDMLNRFRSDPAFGGEIWTLPVNGGDLEIWRAYDGELTGGRIGLTLIPEPTTITLLFGSLVCVAFARKRR